MARNKPQRRHTARETARNVHYLRDGTLARRLHEDGSSRRCKSRRSISCTTFSIKDWRDGLPLFGFRTNLALHFERSTLNHSYGLALSGRSSKLLSQLCPKFRQNRRERF